jgi:hypothetical protein
MDAKKPYVTSIAMPEAEAQVEVRLLPGCKKFILQARPDPSSGESNPFRLYITRDGHYLTVFQAYEEDKINLDSELLIWVASAYPDQVLEVLQWV